MRTRKLFGTSGIRGLVGQDLSPDFCYRVGLATGSTLPVSSTVCIATDTRISRDVVKEAITAGLVATGINVVDLGILPTPALALLTRECGFTAGIMVTASHNPPEFNGIKFFNADSVGYSRTQEAEIEKVFFAQEFRRGKHGKLQQAPHMKETYISLIRAVFSKSRFNHHLKIVVDPGNGAASRLASEIFIQMGLDPLPINDEPNGLFPGRSPEPREDTLLGTVDFLREHNADMAICFDGDADRVVFCDKHGFLGFNEPIAFISRLAVEQTGKKQVATTVETGTLLDLAVKDLGAKVTRGKVGDVAVAHLTRDLDAALGVEQVGVYIIPQMGYYPDSIFTALFLLSQLNSADEIRHFLQNMPRLFFQKAKVSCPDDLKDSVMACIQEQADVLAPTETNAIDGLRLEFPDAWLLIRASGTEPVIRLVCESTSPTHVDELINKGKQLVQAVVESNK